VARKTAPLAASFSGMVLTGLAALKFVNVPMYGALRRLTTFIVIAGQYFILSKTATREEITSVVLMVFGATVAGWGDLEFDLYGYFLTLVNCVVTALYLILIAKTSSETKLSTFSLMFYNNVLSLPFVVLVVLAMEWDTLVKFPLWYDTGFQICFIMSSVQAFLLNYFMFLCSTINSPLTTSITGQLKNIIQTVLGLFLFGGVPITLLLSVGLTISSVAGVWYGHVKYQEQAASVAAKERDSALRNLESGKTRG